MRHAYEWEVKEDKNTIKVNILKIKEEIKRISSVTLRGDFVCKEDREYWVKKLTSLNSKLKSLEQSKN